MIESSSTTSWDFNMILVNLPPVLPFPIMLNLAMPIVYTLLSMLSLWWIFIGLTLMQNKIRTRSELRGVLQVCEITWHKHDTEIKPAINTRAE